MPDNGLPESWRMQKLAEIAVIRRGAGPKYESGTGLVVVSQGCIQPYGIDLRRAKEVSRAWFDSVGPEMRIRAQDTLVNSTGEGTLGRCAAASRDAIGLPFDSHVLSVRTDGVAHGPWVAQYLRSATGQAALQREKGAKTTNQTELGVSRLGAIRLPVPPVAEQRRIAEVLDSIDAAIENTEAVIAATERLRSALLGELLKRGVPGWHTEWKQAPGIGTIPACWEVVRLGDCGKWFSGGTPSKSRPDFWIGPVPWVSPKDMKVRIISDTEDHISQEAAAELRCVPTETILVVVRGMILAHSFPVAMTSREVAFNQDMRALVCRPGIVPGYVLAYLESSRDSLVRLATPSTHGTMRVVSEELFDVQVPKPDEREQGRIRESVSALDERIDIERGSLAELSTLKPAVAEALLSGRLKVGDAR